MKRIFALVVSICMIMSSVSVFALSEDDLYREYTSMDTTSKLTFRLNKPLEVLNLVEDGMFFDFSTDVKSLVEGLFGTEMNIKTKIDVSEDGKKMTMYTEEVYDIPVNKNDQLTLDVNAVVKEWIEIDFSDEENPVCRLVMLSPNSTKYEYSDNLLEDADFLAPMIKGFLSVVCKDGFNENINEIIKKNSTTVIKGNKAEMLIGGEQLKNLIVDVVNYLYDIGVITHMDSDELAGINAAILAFPVGDNTAIKCEYTFKNNILQSSVMHMDINLDIYEIVSYMNKIMGENEVIDLQGNDSSINFGFSAECDYDSLNKPINIELPELTEENSKKLYEDYYDYWYDYVPYEFYEHATYKIRFKVPSDRVEGNKIRLYDVLSGLGIHNFESDDITDGEYVIEKGWWRNEIILYEHSDKVMVDNVEITLSEPIGEFYEEGLTTKQIEEIFGIEYKGVSAYYYDDGYVIYTFSNPFYEYEKYVPENTIESWKFVRLLADERLPYNRDDMEINFTDVVDAFVIDENAIVNANGSINFNFYNRFITFTPDSNIIIVNGEIIKLDKPVRQTEGDYIVGCDFVEKAFNSRLSHMEYDTYSTTTLYFVNIN